MGEGEDLADTCAGVAPSIRVGADWGERSRRGSIEPAAFLQVRSPAQREGAQVASAPRTHGNPSKSRDRSLRRSPALSGYPPIRDCGDPNWVEARIGAMAIAPIRRALAPFIPPPGPPIWPGSGREQRGRDATDGHLLRGRVGA